MGDSRGTAAGADAPGVDARDESFRLFVLEHHTSLFRTALLLNGDRGVAEDLVQTALIRAYAHWPRIVDQEPLAYVRRIVVNAHHDLWRRTRGRERVVESVPEPEPRQYDDPTRRVDTRDALLLALGELTMRERRVVVLRYLLDRSEAETARELGLRRGTVKSTANRAMGKLRTSKHLLDQTSEEAR